MIQQLDPATSSGTPQDSGVSVPATQPISVSQDAGPSGANENLESSLSADSSLGSLSSSLPAADPTMPVAASMDDLLQASQPSATPAPSMPAAPDSGLAGSDVLTVPITEPVGSTTPPATASDVDEGSPLKPIDIPPVTSLSDLSEVGTPVAINENGDSQPDVPTADNTATPALSISPSPSETETTTPSVGSESTSSTSPASMTPAPDAPTPPGASGGGSPLKPATLNGFGSHGLSAEAAKASSLVEMLVANGNLTQAQVEQLTLEQAQTGKSIEALIEEKRLVPEVALTKAKAALYKIPFVDLSEIGISPEALVHLPESVAQRYSILPFALNKQDGTLLVAMKDPLDLSAIDFAAQKSGFRIVPHYAIPSQLDQTLSERYAQSLSSEVTEALKEAPQVAEARVRDQNLSVLSGEVVRQAPITKIVETILAFAVQARASDVHIEPQEARTRVRYRIDGILTEKLILPKSVHEAVVSRVKILSSLKIDEKRVPQDGRFNFTTNGENVDLRVSTLPTIHGEKIVMRLLKKDTTVPTLGELGLDGQALQVVEEVIKIPRGIVLVVGPTGSGKTTTLYSVLHQVNSPKVNIVTLEDPVEYEMPGINQVQINPQAGLTFASGLRSFLRQDPNIIMVGEIRDTETVELAVQASLTGHLVFSTLHTSSAAGSIPRLLDMGAERFLLASSITMAIGQRIVRRLNDEFKEEYEPDPAVVEDIKKVLGPRFDAWCQQNGKDPNKVTLYRSRSDRPGAEPEYRGRIGIFEVLRVTEEVSRMIFDRATAMDLEKHATKTGMLLMKQDGYLKALDGVTTIEEVLRVAEV